MNDLWVRVLRTIELKGSNDSHRKTRMEEATRLWIAELAHLPMMFDAHVTEFSKVQAWLEQNYDGDE